MAVTVTHDLTTLYTGNAAFGGASTSSTAMPSRFGSSCLAVTTDRGIEHRSGSVTPFSLVGRTIYSWLAGPATLETKDNGGIRIVIGDGTNTRAYFVGGYGHKAFMSGGWNCYTLNGDSLPTQFAQIDGSAQPNLSNISVVGFGFNHPGKAVGGALNTFASICRVGTGLIITGGTAGDPGTFQDIFDLDESTSNAWGIIERLGEGLWGSQGRLTFGSTSANSYFMDRDATLYFSDILSGANFYELNVQGSASHTNVFQLGTKLGSGDSAVGANGCNIINGGAGLKVDFTDNNIDTLIYGTNFSYVSNGILFGTKTDNETISCNFDQSGKVSPGSAVFRNCTFSATTDDNYNGSAVLWNNNINISNCTFNAHSHASNNPAAIEHPAAGVFDYNTLMFSGNDIDVRNTSGGAVVISAVGGSNPDQAKTTGDTTIQVSASLTLSGIVAGSRVRILAHGTTTVLASTENSGSSFIYSYTSAAAVDIVITHLSYQYFRIENYSLTGVDASIPIAQRFDRIYFNP